MIPRILSIAGPALVYVTLAAVITGLWHERRKFEWLGVAPALAGLLASFLFLSPTHRLFFDEDIYISIAQNLTHAPVAQITLLGGQDSTQVSTYYKEPPGWPVLLSLIFLVTGRSETAAFVVARLFFAATIVIVYQLTREAMGQRRQAVVAALVFGAAPVCFWFSPSAGTDIPAAFAVAFGLWGIVSGNGLLAASGFALAAQMRLELIVLVPLVWLSRRVSWKWKWITAALVSVEVIHILWVLSIAPVLAAAEKVESAFGTAFVAENLRTNLTYMFNPMVFPAGVTGLAVAALCLRERVGAKRRVRAGKDETDPHRRPIFLPEGDVLALLVLQIFTLFGVYLLFYAGHFDINPRYTIQFLLPLVLIATSISTRPLVIGLLLASMTVPYLRPLELPTYVAALAEDHRISMDFAQRFGREDLILSTEPEMFLNHNRRAMNAVFASQHRDRLEEELRLGKVWYHSGVRTNRPETLEWNADQWVKSNFELHLIDSREIRGMRMAFYEVLLKNLDREAR